MKPKKISSAHMSLIAFLLFISWNNSAKAIPMAPPMCEVEATINKIDSKISKMVAIGNIKIFSSQNANYATNCDTYSNTTLNGIKIGAYDASYNQNSELLVPGTKIKGFLMLPDNASSKDMSEYYLDNITIVDRFYGTGKINEKISLFSNLNILTAAFIFLLLLCIFIIIYALRQKYKTKK